MKPTFYLKYVEVDHDMDEPLCVSYKYGEPEFFKLQQWWEDEEGNGEWRFVDIDFRCEGDRPIK